ARPAAPPAGDPDGDCAGDARCRGVFRRRHFGTHRADPVGDPRRAIQPAGAGPAARRVRPPAHALDVDPDRPAHRGTDSAVLGIEGMTAIRGIWEADPLIGLPRSGMTPFVLLYDQ